MPGSRRNATQFTAAREVDGRRVRDLGRGSTTSTCAPPDAPLVNLTRLIHPLPCPLSQIHRDGERPRRPTRRCRCRAFQKDDEEGGAAHHPSVFIHRPFVCSKNPAAARQKQSLRPVISVRRVRVHHGGRGESDRVRGGAAEGGASVAAAAAAEAADEAGQDRAPAPPLHAPVVRRRRQRRGDEEAAAGRGRGGGRRRRRPALLRVARRLHRELPQEPGLRDHLRPPRHGGVRGGGGGGGDDGGLAVQEAGHGADRGGDGAVPGRGGVRGHVRVGLQRARPDRADAHPRLQLLRGRAHRQRRRRALLRRPDAGLVRRRLSTAHRCRRPTAHTCRYTIRLLDTDAACACDSIELILEIEIVASLRETFQFQVPSLLQLQVVPYFFGDGCHGGYATDYRVLFI